MISTNKKYQTRSGLPVTILSTEYPKQEYPVLGYIMEGTYAETNHWTLDGKYIHTLKENHPMDLIPIPESAEYLIIWGQGNNYSKSPVQTLEYTKDREEYWKKVEGVRDVKKLTITFCDGEISAVSLSPITPTES